MRREEICEVELVPKTALDGMDDEKAVAPEEQDIYGVRLASTSRRRLQCASCSVSTPPEKSVMRCLKSSAA